MRYTGPKAKKARRLGMAFTAKDVKILQKRNFAPGQHGQSRARLSEYGTQLREKQKAKISYGILERQFEIYFKRALKQTGVTGDNLLKLLEMRLDNIVYRLGFAETRLRPGNWLIMDFLKLTEKKLILLRTKPKSVTRLPLKKANKKKLIWKKLRKN